MLPLRFFWGCLGWASLLALGGAMPSQPAAPAQAPPPTLAQVRQAFSAAHPVARLCVEEGEPFIALGSPQNVLACLSGDELVLRHGARSARLHLAPHRGSYLHFDATVAGRDVGAVDECLGQYDDLVCFMLTLSDTRVRAALGGVGDAQYIALDDTSFHRVAYRFLAQAAAALPVAVLNDKGFFLQQLGYPHESLPFFAAVLRRTPTRAVAYLNQGDAHWQLGQPAAALADYRRYLALLRSQHKDTTRVPAYVRMALLLK